MPIDTVSGLEEHTTDEQKAVESGGEISFATKVALSLTLQTYALDDEQRRVMFKYLWAEAQNGDIYSLGLGSLVGELGEYYNLGTQSVEDLTDQTYETIRAKIYQVLLKLFQQRDSGYITIAKPHLQTFLENILPSIPGKVVNPDETYPTPDNLDYGDRVLLTMALLARDALTHEAEATDVLPRYSLPRHAVNRVYQYGWKFGMIPSARRISKLLSRYISVDGKPSIAENTRRNNIESALKYSAGANIADVMSKAVFIEINRMLVTGSVPEAHEGALRFYNGQMEYASHKFPDSVTIPEQLDQLAELTKGELMQIRSLPESLEKQERTLHLATYVCARINQLKPFLEGNGRTAFVAANLVLTQAGASYHFVVPGIMKETPTPDYIEYVSAVNQTVDIDMPVSFQDHGNQALLELFIRNHSVPRIA